eukprot:TRINITY_DN4702_c0_g1_i2.p3 TRINITY_DN4702_c0_g1~~TRINITY_DN4702_c0_g1_i2.p3  ORF type:complete len:111 (-),score=29.33 TRINITY_DN4702_c0_g1_i2:58-390(-)
MCAGMRTRVRTGRLFRHNWVVFHEQTLAGFPSAGAANAAFAHQIEQFVGVDFSLAHPQKEWFFPTKNHSFANAATAWTHELNDSMRAILESVPDCQFILSHYGEQWLDQW